jgi:bifunctional non-homologous end joining protein LigD
MVRRTDPRRPAGQHAGLVSRCTRRPAAPRTSRWGYELRWDGVRALAYVSGGRLRLLSESDEDVTSAYPWLRDLAEELAPTEAVLDGVLVDIDRAGRVRPAPPVSGSRRDPAGQYLVFDLLWLEGVSTVELPYAQRRELLDGLALAGTHWQTPPWFRGAGADALATAREQGLPGVVAKRLDGGYQPGRRSRHWLSIDVG